MEEKEVILNERNADPQRGWSYVGSEKTSKLNMVDTDGQVPQDLEDEKVDLFTCLDHDRHTDEFVSTRNTSTYAGPMILNSQANGLPSPVYLDFTVSWRVFWPPVIISV